MKTQSGDEFTPTGVDPLSWSAFEGRIQQRRFRSLLENIEWCIDRHDMASARAAFDEARTLRPDAPELSRLEARLVGQRASKWRRDFRVSGPVITGGTILLAGVSLLLVGGSALRRDATSVPGNSSPTSISASARPAPPPGPIGDNGRAIVGSTGSVRDLPTAAPPSSVATRGALAAPSPSPLRKARTAPSHPRLTKRVAAVATSRRQPSAVTASSADAASPATAPTVTLRATPSAPTPGSPVSLTVTVTVPTGGAAPRVIVDWGDGTRQDIGLVPTIRTITHAYAATGAYAITAAATWGGETSGNARPASTLTPSLN